jgi:DNA replication protein DnaC
MKTLGDRLSYLKLGYMKDHHVALATEAARQRWTPQDYLERLVEGEVQERAQRAMERRLRAARFPTRKTLDQFDWTWPKKINEAQVRQLFRLGFLDQKANVLFLGGVGLGKSHLSVALAYKACEMGHTVLFTTAVDAVNHLLSAQVNHRLKQELSKYLRPSILVLDEVGFLPLDKIGADLFFQIVSQRYERGSIIFTSNLAPKQWTGIFAGDASLTSAILDRVLHRAESVVIEGKSYRMKDRVEDP